VAKVIDKDHGWKALAKQFRAAQKLVVRVGYLQSGSGGASHGAKRGTAGVLTNAQLAGIHEYGVPGWLPERSFLRTTFDAKHTELIEMTTDYAAAIIGGQLDVKTALGRLGAFLTGAIRSFVVGGGVTPPTRSVSARQVKRALRAMRRAKAGIGPIIKTTLVDTGRMIGALTWAIGDDRG